MEVTPSILPFWERSHKRLHHAMSTTSASACHPRTLRRMHRSDTRIESLAPRVLTSL
ncbi:hypothetical protein [Streptomyces lancefieldiae]|uniref:Uncharacterized protein n=1 Tax=Streptomyces lancefieldiae TaxID=3075520 RepID=A0ABU3AIE6_9ACTN|nr:hypothetical protein [Streptomyces sp. DSM 40712]MDT0609317.1 hypothetical protein [Streptomyces sp. DSM 40712]